MSNEIPKYKVLSSLVWKLMERGGTQGIQFLVTLVLARLLLPEEFGIIIIVTIYIAVANVFVQSGLNTALVQKKNADETDFSSVFFLSLFIASLLYILIYFTAPFVSIFYEEPELTSILRVLSIILFFGAVNSIQFAVVSRLMQFKKLFVSSLGAISISGAVGILMAYSNFGVWALVWQQLINQIVISVILWFTVKWRPKLTFSIERIKGLFSYGWKLMVSSLIDTLYTNLRSLFIGKMFSPTILGFYNRGEQFPSLIVSNINGSIQSVMLPTLSSYQDDKTRVKEIVRRSIVTSSFIIFPMMIGLAVISEPLIRILLTEKWGQAVPFLQIFCASYALIPIHTANLQAINALGRTDIYLKLEVIKKTFGLIILVITIPFGVYAIALGVLVTGIVSSFINAYPNIKLINYSFKEQLRDVIPSLLISLIMGGGIYCLQGLELKGTYTLLLQVLTGIVLYIGLAKVFKLECYIYLKNTVKEMLKNKKEMII